jgi:hypothetical protein
MKKIISIIIVSLIIISNAHAGLISKLPILGCVIEGENFTYDLRDHEVFKNNKKFKDMSKVVIVSDDQYIFTEQADQGDGTIRSIRYNVNRYTGIIDVTVSPKYIHRKNGGDPQTALRKALSVDFTANGTCRGAK